MLMSRRLLIMALSACLPLGRASANVRRTAMPYTHRFRSRMIDLSDTRLEVLEAGKGPTTFVCTHPYFDASGPFPAGGLTEALASAGRTLYVCPRGTAASAEEHRR